MESLKNLLVFEYSPAPAHPVPWGTNWLLHILTTILSTIRLYFSLFKITTNPSPLSYLSIIQKFCFPNFLKCARGGWGKKLTILID